VPEAAQGTQAWDRFAYVNNSPTKWIDPTGHSVDCSPGDPNCHPEIDNSSENDHEQNTKESIRCPGAIVSGALLVIALAPIDIAIVSANISMVGVPVVGPILEMAVLVPIDIALFGLHLVAISLMSLQP